MKGLIQVESSTLAFSSTPTLQYSSTPKLFVNLAGEALRSRFVKTCSVLLPSVPLPPQWAWCHDIQLDTDFSAT